MVAINRQDASQTIPATNQSLSDLEEFASLGRTYHGQVDSSPAIQGAARTGLVQNSEKVSSACGHTSDTATPRFEGVRGVTEASAQDSEESMSKIAAVDIPTFT